MECLRRLALLGWMSCGGASLLADSGDWVPGREREWQGPGEPSPLRVYVPEDYAPSKRWPVIYWFHGTGSRASTLPIQAATEGRGFVVVGVAYAVPGEGSLSQAGIVAEIERLERVRESLGKELSLDGRIWVGGFSKGGWMADLLATEGFPGLQGALILGAGRIPGGVGKALGRPAGGSAREASLRPLEIYLGIGQSDTNHVYTRRARRSYHDRGHRVTFEVYWATGHRFGEGQAVYLSQWLAIQRQGRASAALQEVALDWWNRALAGSETLSSPIERLLVLQWLLESPYAALVQPARRQEGVRMVDRAWAHRSLREEGEARRAYRLAWEREEAFERSDDLVDVAHRFAQIHRRFPRTWFGQRALLDVDRLRRNYAMLRRGRETGARRSAGFPEVMGDRRQVEARFQAFGALLASVADPIRRR